MADGTNNAGNGNGNAKESARRGARRAAALIVSLGPDAAAPLLRNLDASALALLAEGGRGLAKDGVDDVVSAFVAAMESEMPPLSANSFQSVWSAALGEGSMPVRMEDGTLRGPVALLRDAGIEETALLLEREPPHIAALVLSSLAPEKAASLLSKLPRDAQPSIVRSLATLEALPQEVVDDVLGAFATQLSRVGARRSPVGGEEATLKLLRKIAAADQKALMEDLARDDAELAEKLRGKLFAFEDLGTLSRRDVQTVLATVDARALAVALKGAPASVVDVVMTNMSQRAAAGLKEQIDMLGRLRLSQVEQAQAQIVKDIMKLAEDGRVTLASNEEMV